MRWLSFAIVMAMAGAGHAFAASRPPVGGSARLAVVGPAPAPSPLLSDSPVEATVTGLKLRPLCRLQAGSAVPTLARAFERTAEGTLRIHLRPTSSPGRPGGPSAEEVAQTLERARVSTSPYRALVSSLRAAPRATSDTTVELALSGPAPDLERALCHPALAVTGGPFIQRAQPERVEARLTFAPGRPNLDRLDVEVDDARGVLRRLALGEAQLGLGVGGEGAIQAQAALYVTVLALPPSLIGLRGHLERALDRADLVRFFVRGPASPLPSLLPPALLDPASPPVPLAAPAAAAPISGPLTLLFDATHPDHRPVAERLQLRLRAQGIRLELQALSRDALRSRPPAANTLVLHSLLLPAVPGPALSVLLAAAHQPELAREEESELSRLTDPMARDARARELATSLAPRIALVPLYVQSLAVRAAPALRGLAFDAQGLLLLDDAYLSAH